MLRRRIAGLSSSLIVTVALVTGCNVSHSDDGANNEIRGYKPLKLDVGQELSCFAFSPDRRFLATSNGPQMWDLETGTEVSDDRPENEHSTWCAWMAFSPDGRYLAGVHETGDLRLPRAMLEVWSVDDQNRLRRLWKAPCADRGNPTEAFHIAFSPDSNSVCFASPDETVHVWESATGKEKLKFQGGVAAAYSPDGEQLAAVRHDGAIRHYDAATGKPLTENLRGKNPAFLYVDHASFSDDGSRVVISDNYVILVKDTKTGANLSRLETDSNGVLLSPDGNTLAVHVGGEVAFFNAITGEKLGQMHGEMTSIGAFAFSRDSTAFAWVENRKRDFFGKDTCVHVREMVSLPLTGDVPSKPPELPLRAELLVGTGESILDMKGKSPDEFSQALFDNPYELIPKVDWELQITNISNETITVEDPDDTFNRPEFTLVGPGAINRPSSEFQVGERERNPNKDIQLAPGRSHSFPIKQLSFPHGYSTYVMDGEYVVRAEIALWLSPPPKSSRSVIGGVGSVAIIAAPVRVHVKAAR